MELERSLLKSFADLTNGSKDERNTNAYLRGTAKVSDDSKYVQIDGSSMLTPITETVDVQNGDRVLVSIENHKATIIGNLSYPPNARKEEEALGKADDALDKADNANANSNAALEKAEDAKKNAVEANENASLASTQAQEAKQSASEAIDAAATATQNAKDAQSTATEAKSAADVANENSKKAQESASLAQNEVGRINTEVESVKGDISGALTELGELSEKTETIKETMEVSYAKKTDVSEVEASLKSEISKSVGELQTTISQEYAAKTDVVQMEGKLQTQITQNSELLNSQATKVEKIEADTAEAQKQVDAAKESAQLAQAAADEAKTKADTAQSSADAAKDAADTASQKAEDARTQADAAKTAADKADAAVQTAQTDLNEAKKNLETVTGRVDATEEEVAAAQAAVEQAQQNVIKAMEDAATADAAAKKAQSAATQAQTDAETAKGVANDAQAKAENAKTAADNAQKAADKAQADVAALTKRVTTAETNISQNAEKIALNATKTEEIGDELKNNYYSKTEADAAIEVSANNIKQSVAETYTTKTDVSKNVVSTQEEFYLSTSSTSLAGGSWSTTPPTWQQGKYIWRRTKVTYFDKTTGYTPGTNGVCITGNTGSQGNTGQGISDVTIEFYLSTSKTTPTGGSWSTTQPTWSSGKYLWTRQKITYVNPSKTVYTTPVCDSSWEAVNNVEIGGRNLYALSKNTQIGKSSSVSKLNMDVSNGDVTLTVSGSDPYVGNVLSTSQKYAAYHGQKIPTQADKSIAVSLTNDLFTKNYISFIDENGVAVRNFKSYGSSKFVVSPSEFSGASHIILRYGIPDNVATVGQDYSTKIKMEYGTVHTDWSPAPEDVDQSIKDAVDGIEIGGKNLVPGTEHFTNGWEWNTSFATTTDVLDKFNVYHSKKAASDGIVDLNFKNAVNIQPNTEYTLSFWVKGTGSFNSFFWPANVAYGINSDGTTTTSSDGKIGHTLKSDWERYWITWKTLPTATGYKNIIPCRQESGVASEVWLYGVKLEKGNKPTDWSPAPEDVDTNIGDAIAESEKQITEQYKSLIESTSQQIQLMVNSLKSVTDGHTTSISSLSNQLQITSEMAQFVKTTTETLQQAVDGKMSASEIREWARFDGANLELGSSNSPFKCQLSTTELAFYQGNKKVAWISNNELHVLTAVIATSIGCGNFTFVDEGELGFSLI